MRAHVKPNLAACVLVLALLSVVAVLMVTQVVFGVIALCLLPALQIITSSPLIDDEAANSACVNPFGAKTSEVGRRAVSESSDTPKDSATASSGCGRLNAVQTPTREEAN